MSIDRGEQKNKIASAFTAHFFLSPLACLKFLGLGKFYT